VSRRVDISSLTTWVVRAGSDLKEAEAEAVPSPAHAPIGHNAGPPLLPEPEPQQLMEWTTPTLIEIEYTDELRQLYRCEVVEKYCAHCDGNSELIPFEDVFLHRDCVSEWIQDH